MANNLKCEKEVISFTAMAAIEIIGVARSTLFKAAALNGLSFFALITYSYLIGSLLFLPLIFIFPREGVPSIFNLPILLRFVLLAFVEYTSTVCGYIGIEYTSPTIASCISNLVPASTFIFAALFRLENVDFRRKKTITKTIGTIVSVSGALVTTLFKGPVILTNFSPENLLRSFNTDWVIGGLLLVGSFILCSLAFIIQTQIVKSYPNEITVGVLSTLLTSIVGAIVGLFLETNGNAWKLRTDLALITVVITGVFGPCLTTVVHTWGLNRKGPLYVSIFKPFSIVIAAIMGVSFLGDSLYLGSFIGAIIILLGFYAVIWGKTEEEEEEFEEPKNFGSDLCLGTSSSPSSDKKIPLLTSYRVVPNSRALNNMVV